MSINPLIHLPDPDGLRTRTAFAEAEPVVYFALKLEG
jgi:hypothetical protein